MLLTLGLLGPSSAAAGELEPDQQALLLLRVLSYDRALEGRSLRLGIVYRRGDDAGQAYARAVARSFRTLAERSPLARGVRVFIVPMGDGNEYEAAMAEQNINVVYASRGLGSALRRLSEHCDDESLPLLTGTVGYIRAGAAVAVTEDAGRPRIVVHLSQSRAQGMRLHGSLLRLATVIR
ncbi:MAG: YfiR family protein [Myxococcota bacterium]